MSKGKAPKTPDPYKVADAQTKSNIETAQTQTELNRFNQETPFGTVSWAQDPDNPNKYTSSVNYDPQTQRIIDTTKWGIEGLTGNAYQVLGQPLPRAPGTAEAASYLNTTQTNMPGVKSLIDPSLTAAGEANNYMRGAIANANQAIATPFNFDNAPAMPVADEATRQAIANALYGQSTSRLDPKYNQASSNLESKLAAQGITVGSEAHNREVDNLARDRNDAYQSAMNASQLGSLDAMNNLFGMGMSARKQGVDEIQAMRDQALKEALGATQVNTGATGTALDVANMNAQQLMAQPQIAKALLDLQTAGASNEYAKRDQTLKELGTARNILNSSVPNLSPGIAGDSSVAPTDLAGSVYNSFGGDLQKYAGQVGSANNLMSGLGMLGAAGLMAPAGTMAGIGSGIMGGLGALAAF